MKISVNKEMNVTVESKDLIRELIKVTKERCWCSFYEDRELYDELFQLIKKRKKEPVDPGCIE